MQNVAKRLPPVKLTAFSRDLHELSSDFCRVGVCNYVAVIFLRIFEASGLGPMLPIVIVGVASSADRSGRDGHWPLIVPDL